MIPKPVLLDPFCSNAECKCRESSKRGPCGEFMGDEPPHQQDRCGRCGWPHREWQEWEDGGEF